MSGHVFREMPAVSLSPDQRFFGWLAAINSALYLSACFVAGMAWQVKGAVLGALVAFGFCFICYTAQLVGAPRWFSGSVSALSIVAGVIAGLFFLAG